MLLLLWCRIWGTIACCFATMNAGSYPNDYQYQERDRNHAESVGVFSDCGFPGMGKVPASAD